MKIIFLGTGAGIPSKERNTSSIAFIWSEKGNETWLFDCAEGTQHQILQTEIKLSNITKIFITHLHGDHIYGLLGLLSTRSFQEKEVPITIYGPVGIQEFVLKGLEISQTYITYPLEFVEFDMEAYYMTLDHADLEVRILNHTIDSYGYRIVEHDKPGRLNIEKLQSEGIKPGPIYQKLKRGETVLLDDGREIFGKDYLGEKKKGKIIVIFGDTAPAKYSKILAQNADVLIHEATLEHEMIEQANNNMHSTTIQAAKLAKETGVKKLILTHISARYIKDESERLLSESKTIFCQTYIAHDFFIFEI